MRQISTAEELDKAVKANDETAPTWREEEDLRSANKIFVIGQWSFVIDHLEKSGPLIGGAEAEGFGVDVRSEVTHSGAAVKASPAFAPPKGIRALSSRADSTFRAHNTGRVIAPSAAEETKAAYLAKTPDV
jgi:hypothetical protein